MASAAICILVVCVLLFAGGYLSAIGGRHGLAQEKKLPWEASTKGMSPAGTGRTAEQGASTGLVLARRKLAARLGGATKGSSPAKGSVKGAVHPDDAAALLKAAARWKKDDDTVDERNLLASWDVKRPCSQWFGVSCDSATHRVTAIKLTGLRNPVYIKPFFSLAGPFPAELGSLPELRSLILARNYQLGSGTFPKTWARLTKLSHLDLSGNVPFEPKPGAIPVPVPLTLCNLTGLTYLNMAGTGFGKLPKQFKSLKKLAWLDLSNQDFDIRHLNGMDTQTLGSLPGLRSLFLRGSGLSGLPDVEGLSSLHSLKLLDLSGNAFPASFWKGFPTFLNGLTGLEDLRLRSLMDPLAGKPPGPAPTWLGRLQQLTSLDLAFNVFSGSLPSQLGALSKLAKLVLSDNILSGKVPQSISNSRTLFHINLGRNGLSLAGITFGPHASSRLRELDLSNNDIKGAVPQGLSSLTRLETLSLSSNVLSGGVPAFLWTLPTLTKLDLSFNRLTGLGPSSQQIKATRLKSLDLSENSLKGSIPKGWSALKSLTALSLGSNKFTGSIPSWLGALRGLVYLDLAYNKLTGSIPSWLGALRGLTSLDLRKNELTGSLPGSIFRGGLQLNVAGNQLSGNLPAKALDLFAQLFVTAIKSDLQPGPPDPPPLDVSGNYLTGPCYSAAVPWWQNASRAVCNPDCPQAVYNVLQGLFENCLQGCEKASRDPSNPIFVTVPTSQRSKAECARFCGADKRNGPCNGRGSCSLKGPKKTPTCTCSKGFVAPASKPGTCVPAPNK